MGKYCNRVFFINHLQLSKIWFDRKSIHIGAVEDRKSLMNIFPYVEDLIHRELDLGISLQRIVVGKFIY